MMALRLTDFGRFFTEVHTPCGAECRVPCAAHPAAPTPFAWQSGYLERVAADGVWPDLDIPTGLGKTSLIDIWAFLLAWQLGRGVPRTVPSRLFFVVDRRLVVDQAHEHARLLAHRLETAAEGSVLAVVAAALRAHGGADPLEVVRMRGGVDWASRWLSSPAQPAVVTATVDQFGSRLAFRGYHTSAAMRPIDAALCGTDSLLAVDEAHIALPLLSTARACADHQATASDPAVAGRSVQVVSLSATARTGGERPRFSLPAEDWDNAVAARRLKADRAVTTLDAAGWSRTAADAFAAAAHLSLDALLAAAERPVIGIIANTIASARAAHRRVASRGDVDTLLLTGRCRPAERDLLLADPLMRELLDGTHRTRERPLVVVATQTVEVGWDVSFAGMCTEVPSLDALIQRLGRCNRRGDLAHAPILVVRAQAPKPSDEHTIPVYGAAAARTWEWLTRHRKPLRAAESTPQQVTDALSDGTVLNPATLSGLLAEENTEDLTPPAPIIPTVHATLVDSWARTHPAPHLPFDQPLDPFLHGLATSQPDAQVAWRADIPLDGDPTALTMPSPHARELVAIPARQLRLLLAGERGTGTLSDIETDGGPEAPDRATAPAGLLRWIPPDSRDTPAQSWERVTTLAAVVPGGIYLIPSDIGGHDAYGFTDSSSATVPDLGDFPHRPALTATRLDARVLGTLLGSGDVEREALRSRIAETVDQLRRTESDDGSAEPPGVLVTELLGELRGIAETQTATARFAGHVARRLGELGTIPTWEVSRPRLPDNTGRVIIEGDARIVLTPPRSLRARAAQSGVGDDDADTTSLTTPVSLSRHGEAVARRAADVAAKLALPQQLIDAVRLAGHAHDAGKAHPRFQCMLCEGDALVAESLPEPLAKSGMDPADRTARLRSARLAKWPTKLRHEALSAAAVSTWLTSDPPHAADLDHQLITHLVAAHHGRARPLLPPEADPDPIDVTCTMPDGQHVTVNSSRMGTDWTGDDRFTALNQRYGPWGLALLETVVRLADMSCSEEGT